MAPRRPHKGPEMVAEGSCAVGLPPVHSVSSTLVVGKSQEQSCKTWHVLLPASPFLAQSCSFPVCRTGRNVQMPWVGLGEGSWRHAGSAGPDVLLGGVGSLVEGYQPATAVPEGGWLPLGLCQHQDLLLRQAGRQYWVLLARQVVGLTKGWLREKHRGYGGA